MEFKLCSECKPTGDQPQVIADLVKGFREGNQFQTLLGVTGSGKTFIRAKVIAALNKPNLITRFSNVFRNAQYGLDEMKQVEMVGIVNGIRRERFMENLMYL